MNKFMDVLFKYYMKSKEHVGDYVSVKYLRENVTKELSLNSGEFDKILHKLILDEPDLGVSYKEGFESQEGLMGSRKKVLIRFNI